MDEIYTLTHKVGYFQVDHEHRIQLSSLFKLLQEAAIHHANQAEIGAHLMEKGESWILNRVAMKLERYPQFDETITIHTWSTGLKHFKGFRDFRIFIGDEMIGQVSTLWLYIDYKQKSIARLPKEIEQTFPQRPEDVYFKNLDRLRLPKPGEQAATTQISLRYSDIDGNQHVNNAAYMDFLQTALQRQKLGTRPKTLEIQFAKEIPPNTERVSVLLEPKDEGVSFGLSCKREIAAFGRLL